MNMNNGYGEDSNIFCYFHPKEIVIGICPLCLNERLLVLASKQDRNSHRRSKAFSEKEQQQQAAQAASINLPKIFTFGSLLNRFEFKHWKSDISDERDACGSQEDSFISIKFENNGVACLEKGTVSTVSLDHCSNNSWKNNGNSNSIMINENKSVIEHAKQRGATFRWGKRIGHLLQLVRWKRSNNKGNVDGVKVTRKGWIRTLTKRGGPKNKGIL